MSESGGTGSDTGSGGSSDTSKTGKGAPPEPARAPEEGGEVGTPPGPKVGRSGPEERGAESEAGAAGAPEVQYGKAAP